ncbi:MAG: cytochrome c family protein [Planctomycetes bacterium]|nr:cytochrome c family protein [Planctomycetota bacterium]
MSGSLTRMITLSASGLLLGGAFAAVLSARGASTPLMTQELPPATTQEVSHLADVEDIACSACHTCEHPTPENLCLRGCLRGTPEAIAMELLRRKRGPDVVILDELENLYLPVPFDHKGHADMADMTIGCSVCHHYTPEGARHPACKDCHEVSPMREDMRKPSLKAAYHRQCLACHREWSHETACEICHLPKAGSSSLPGGRRVPTKDDIMGHMHPPIPEPDVATYQTKHKYRAGTKVMFRHKEHIHRFGFKCAECHHEDSCSRCHEEGKSEADRPKTLEEHHNPCAHCHDMEDPERCGHCHYLEGEPEPPRFDHTSTGWPLGRYHKDKSCRVCHATVRFVKLDRECNTCHAAWATGNFDHAVTGQALDENHVETDCAECHVDRKFSVPPACGECHDEDEGIAFPDKRPGPVVEVKTPGGDAKPGESAGQKGTVPSSEKNAGPGSRE